LLSVGSKRAKAKSAVAVCTPESPPRWSVFAGETLAKRGLLVYTLYLQ
jgi:hypothetical protein